MKRFGVVGLLVGAALCLPAASGAGPTSGRIPSMLKVFPNPLLLGPGPRPSGPVPPLVQPPLRPATTHVNGVIHWADGTSEHVDLGTRVPPQSQSELDTLAQSVIGARGRAEAWAHDRSMVHGARQMASARMMKDGEDEFCTYETEIEPFSNYPDPGSTIIGTTEINCDPSVRYVQLDAIMWEDWDPVDAQSNSGSTTTTVAVYAGCITNVYAEIDTDVYVTWGDGTNNVYYDAASGYGC